MNQYTNRITNPMPSQLIAIDLKRLQIIHIIDDFVGKDECITHVNSEN